MNTTVSDNVRKWAHEKAERRRARSKLVNEITAVLERDGFTVVHHLDQGLYASLRYRFKRDLHRLKMDSERHFVWVGDLPLATVRGPVQAEEPHQEDGDNKTEKEDFHD